jgi:hypothetical protein
MNELIINLLLKPQYIKTRGYRINILLYYNIQNYNLI